LEVIKHRRTGRKHWTYTFNDSRKEKEWKEVKELLQNQTEETNNTPWGKIVLYSGGILLVVFILYLLVRKYFF
jgi:hypothetical protein